MATPPHTCSCHSTLVRSVLQPAIVLLLEMCRYVEHSVLARKSMLTVNIQHVHARHALLVHMRNTQLCDLDQSGSKSPLEVDWD